MASEWFASRHLAQNLRGTKQPYEVKPQTRSHVRTASPSISLSRGMLNVAPQKPLRADEPVTQFDELGPLRGTACDPTGAAGIETRVRFWCGLVACRAGFSSSSLGRRAATVLDRSRHAPRDAFLTRSVRSTIRTPLPLAERHEHASCVQIDAGVEQTEPFNSEPGAAAGGQPHIGPSSVKASRAVRSGADGSAVRWWLLGIGTQQGAFYFIGEVECPLFNLPWSPFRSLVSRSA